VFQRFSEFFTLSEAHAANARIGIQKKQYLSRLTVEEAKVAWDQYRRMSQACKRAFRFKSGLVSSLYLQVVVHSERLRSWKVHSATRIVLVGCRISFRFDDSRNLRASTLASVAIGIFASENVLISRDQAGSAQDSRQIDPVFPRSGALYVAASPAIARSMEIDGDFFRPFPRSCTQKEARWSYLPKISFG